MRIYCDRVANPNSYVLERAMITIDNGRISSFHSTEQCGDDADIILNNAVAFPGLINIHDHLKYSWHKRIGYGAEISENQQHYSNVYNWLVDLYKAYDVHFNDSSEALSPLFQLGLYKQIFSATTTVLNHSRHRKQIIPSEKEYIKIFDDFERELVVQPDLLACITKHPISFGQSIIEAHRSASLRNPKRPFMIHVAEGNDSLTGIEVRILNDLGVLTPETILVHCINTKNEDIDLISKGGCSVVWCPYTSNYVIGRYAHIPTIVSKGINLCIGTDSSCSGSTNLLEEARYAKQQYEEVFDASISYDQLFDMITINAAKALMISNQVGAIRDGYVADIAIVDSTANDPYGDILNSGPESIIAVLCNGRFVFGDKFIANMLPKYDNSIYSSFSINGREKMIVGDPNDVIATLIEHCSINEAVLFPFIPRELQIAGCTKGI